MMLLLVVTNCCFCFCCSSRARVFRFVTVFVVGCVVWRPCCACTVNNFCFCFCCSSRARFFSFVTVFVVGCFLWRPCCACTVAVAVAVMRLVRLVRLVGTGTLSVDVWCVGVGARTWRGCWSMISGGKYACVWVM